MLIANLNNMLDELDCIKRIITIKITLIKFPGKIISISEIDEFKHYFTEFERKIDAYMRSFTLEKEKEAKSKKPKSTETKERFKETEILFEKVKTAEKNIYDKAKFLFEEYNRREKEIFSEDIIPRKVRVVLNSGRNEKSNEEGKEQKDEFLIIEKIFLNTKISINEVDLLKKRKTLNEERTFLANMFELKELFENSQSKQLIMLDYYMNLYSLCINNHFTLQQISTILSIFYFIISYSFSWYSIENKISEIFNSIMEYHSLNNPPFSYQIFNQNQKQLLIDFFDNTFIQNFQFFEIIFRYDVSICFCNQVISKPELNTATDEQNLKKIEITNISNTKEQQDVEEGAEEEKKKEKEEGKSLDDIQDEKEIEMMKNFVNLLYQDVTDIEKKKILQDENMIRDKNIEEANQAKKLLNMKLPEMKKEIYEEIDIQTTNAIRPVEQEIKNRVQTKPGKK